MCILSHTKKGAVWDMPKNYNFKGSILELLDDKELSKKEIFNEIRIESEVLTSDKTLNESLMALLKDGKIYITGYDFNVYNGVKRIQSIKTEGLIFGRVKLDFIELSALIKQLESSDVAEVNDASLKLKSIFKMRVNEVGDDSINLKGLDDIFNRMIYYMDSQKEDQKRVLLKKLAWSLSNEKGSDKTFKNILVYVQSNM
jgi:hypothetical protein